ncbi:hypothetical protein ACFV5C_36240, partial [Streptomyces sp. NPDC059762]
MPRADRPATPGDGEGRADDVYQPTHSDVGNRPSGALDPDNALATDPVDDMSVPGYSPPERPRGVTGHGTTLREQREGESLDERGRPGGAAGGGREGVGQRAQPAGRPRPRARVGGGG